MRAIEPFLLIVVLVVVGVLVTRVIVAARRSGDSGYRLGGDVVVRCREGHLFTTIWIPLVSLKAVRLGLVRLQYCPVGDHLTFVTPVRDSDLTDEERRFAEGHHDRRVP